MGGTQDFAARRRPAKLDQRRHRRREPTSALTGDRRASAVFGLKPPPPHPEEARSAVSKDGRWHHISFVAVLRDARKSALLRTRFSDGSYDSNLGNAVVI